MTRPHCLFPLVAVLLAALTALAGAQGATLRDVRVAQHEDFTRVVFELSSGVHFRVSNLSERYQTITIELHGVDAAPSGVQSTGEERDAFDPRADFDQDRKWYRLRLRTRGAVLHRETTLQDPLRVVIDFQTNSGSQGGSRAASPSASSFSAPSPPAALRSDSSPGGSSNWRRTIIVDPGHGGYHKGGWGMIGSRKIWEKEVALQVAERLERLLQHDPRFDVRMTRRTDVYVGLRERTEIASRLSGDMFISLHCNAVEGAAARQRARGFEIWIWNREGSQNAAARAVEKMENEDPGVTRQNNPILTKMMLDALEAQSLHSRRLAEAVHGAFMTEPYFRQHDRGIKSARFTVLEVYDMPSILVELGFISHPEEARLLANSRHQELMARKLYEGVIQYYTRTDPTFPRSVSGTASIGR